MKEDIIANSVCIEKPSKAQNTQELNLFDLRSNISSTALPLYFGLHFLLVKSDSELLDDLVYSQFQCLLAAGN